MRETSIEAYRTIKEQGLLSKRRMDVYESLYRCGPATAMAVFNELSKNRGNKVAANVYARLSELRTRGVVEELGEVICSITGMRVIQWAVTNKLPVEPKKQTKIKCPLCNGSGHVQ